MTAYSPVFDKMPAGAAIVRVLHAHGILTTAQIHALIRPTKALRYTQHALTQAQRKGLISKVQLQPRDHAVWFLTDLGTRSADGAEPRSYQRRMDEHRAAGPLQTHELSVNQVGVELVRAARVHGDSCSPLDWEHDLRLRISNNQAVRPDSVVYYDYSADVSVRLITRFIELHRGTKSVGRLGEQIRDYVRLYKYRPQPFIAAQPLRDAAWTDRFTRWPGVVVVFDITHPPLLTSQIRRFIGYCQEDDLLSKAAEQIGLVVTTLEHLRSPGPFAPIFVPAWDPKKPVNLIGERKPARPPIIYSFGSDELVRATSWINKAKTRAVEIDVSELRLDDLTDNAFAKVDPSLRWLATELLGDTVEHVTIRGTDRGDRVASLQQRFGHQLVIETEVASPPPTEIAV